jgi:hypothetical protein
VQYNALRMTTQLTQRGRETMELFAAGASADEIAEHLFADLRQRLEGVTAMAVHPTPESSAPAFGQSAGSAVAVLAAAFGTAVLVVLALTIAADALR